MRVLALAFVVFLGACVDGEQGPSAAPTFIGTAGISYEQVEALSSLDNTAAAAVIALENVYGAQAIDGMLAQLHVSEVTAIGQGLDGRSWYDAHGYHVEVLPHVCAGNGSLAHEMAHLASLHVTGDADSQHKNTSLFMDNCKSNACVWATVEMSGRPLCD